MSSRFAGAASLAFDLSGVALRLDGVPPRAARALERDWAAFRVAGGAEAFLSVELHRAGTPAPPAGSFDPKSMRAELDALVAAFHMPEGSIEVDRAGRARAELCEELGPREYFTLLNLLRAGLAWRMPSRGGAMLHAAALVLAGRGFALVGPEGSGKSTWARAAEEGGARVVSDDLILLDAADRGFALLGAPFRSTHRVEFRRGRWPLAALLFPRHGPVPALAPVPPLLAQARIAANLPFVVEALGRDERVEAVVGGLAAGAGCHELTFAADPGFLALFGPAGAAG